MTLLVVLAVGTLTLGPWTPVVAALAGVLVPFLTEIVTKDLASGKLRLLILTLLAAVGGVVASITGQGGSFQLQATVIALLIAWPSAFASQAGLESVLAGVRRRTASFGIGTPGGAPPSEAGQVALGAFTIRWLFAVAAVLAGIYVLFQSGIDRAMTACGVGLILAGVGLVVP